MNEEKTSTGQTASLGYDVATALWQGKRPYQEDTLLADFHGGQDRGFAVLADGMGGHAAGDLASRLVVIDTVSHLKFLMHDGPALEKNLQTELSSAIDTANTVLADRAQDDRRLAGMGATFLAVVMFEDRLYWASVGDSPLYLWREGQLRQLNEDHSMAPIIDQMVKTGELSEEAAATHPDRNALTSVLMGRDVKSKDVPKTAVVLDPGDVLIQASDGLQYLSEAQIAAEMAGLEAGATSRRIADRLMAALYRLDDPQQDNTAIMVLQLTDAIGGGGGAALAAATGAMAAAASKAHGDAPKASAAIDQANAARAVQDPDDFAAGDMAASKSAPTFANGLPRWLLPTALVGAALLGLFFFLGSPRDLEPVATDAVAPSETGGEVAVVPADPVAPVAEVPQTGAPLTDAPQTDTQTTDGQTTDGQTTIVIDDTDITTMPEPDLEGGVTPATGPAPETATGPQTGPQTQPQTGPEPRPEPPARADTGIAPQDPLGTQREGSDAPAAPAATTDPIPGAEPPAADTTPDTTPPPAPETTPDTTPDTPLAPGQSAPDARLPLPPPPALGEDVRLTPGIPPGIPEGRDQANALPLSTGQNLVPSDRHGPVRGAPRPQPQTNFQIWQPRLCQFPDGTQTLCQPTRRVWILQRSFERPRNSYGVGLGRGSYPEYYQHHRHQRHFGQHGLNH